MNRRSLIASAVAALTGSMVGAKVMESHQDETGVFILHLGDQYGHPGEEQMERMQAYWCQLWKGSNIKPPVLLIVPPGAVLRPVGEIEVHESLGDYSYNVVAKDEATVNRLLDRMHPKRVKKS